MDQERDIRGPETNGDAEWEAYLDEVLSYTPEQAEAETVYQERLAA
jgi:hypothetical protein